MYSRQKGGINGCDTIDTIDNNHQHHSIPAHAD